MKFTIGADPEVLLNMSGIPISAIGILPGSKHSPHEVDGGGSLHPDNVTAEFGILPAREASEFSSRIDRMLNMIETMASLEIMRGVSSTEFSEDQLIHPDSQVVGCEPDYNAYTGRKNTPPEYKRTKMRVAGGHIHIGYSGLKSKKDIKRFIQLCDLYITLPALANGLEDDTRRKLYGKAGAYRSKPYGVEYRTPSNWWVFEEKHRVWVYNQIERVITAFEAGEEGIKGLSKIINSGDKDRAEEICEEYCLGFN